MNQRSVTKEEGRGRRKTRADAKAEGVQSHDFAVMTDVEITNVRRGGSEE
jgi:hypothetical protein